MHVPYSMDDSEPDLYGTLGSHEPDGPRQASLNLEPTPMYVFYSKQELAQSEVFQELLGLTLKHKTREIDELRVEILELHEELYRLKK